MKGYNKKVLEHSDLYIVTFDKSPDLSYIIFVHGGPGLNCGILEYLIEHEGIFNTLNFNVVLYDQRGCGRSKAVEGRVTHADNVQDLEEVCKAMAIADLKISAIAGHSYGAKLVYDYFQYSQADVPGIFISTAPSILTPRITNLLLDLSYLKAMDKAQYQEIFEEFEDFSPTKIWGLTERLAKVFQTNKTRPFFYWANLVWQEKVKSVQDTLSLPMNYEVFTKVRQDLYSNPKKYSVDLTALSSVPYLWINGLHDLIMDGPSALNSSASPTTLFFKSAHYPHIEEHERFCEKINAFLK